MDDDLKRWRKMGTDPLFHEPLSNGAVFATRKKHRKPSKPEPVHIPHKHTSKTNLTQSDHGLRVKQERVFVHTILDRISSNQKKDIDVLWSGHLNHNNINRILETEALKQRKFGASKHVPPAANLSKQQQQQKEKATFAAEDGVPVQDDQSPETSHQSIGHIDVPDNMHQLLEQFDSVKLRQNNVLSSAIDAEDDAPPQPVNTETQFRSLEPKKELTKRKYLPAYQLNTTRHEQYKALKTADHDIVQSEWTRKKESLRSSKLSELSTFLKTELEALGCTHPGPDMKRLQVYRYVFDRIISDFRHYGPLLAEIKSEYDSFIESHDMDQTELNFLRAKVRKLLAQNENRLLLKFERKKSLNMETQIARLKHENEFLNAELRRKLALYAGYLPQAIWNEKKRDDAILSEIEGSVRRGEGAGGAEDPITLYERQIKRLTQEDSAKATEIAELRRAQEHDFVPKELHNTLELNHKDVTSRFLDLSEEHGKLEEELQTKVATVAKLEAALKEKEEQYHFLIAEYTGLTESMAKK
ncbi:Translin-associated factor X-interacting protein 1 [Chytriomyces hyalinus]|nr:Translin-associated factor X-interacting protein 1 [Chytriomyces hyalinus]